MENGELPVPVGMIDEVAFPVTKGTIEDDPLAPPTVLEDRGRDPVPVGPAEMAESAGVEYGAEDEMVPPARLEELD
jgi:hypothetical protein